MLILKRYLLAKIFAKVVHPHMISNTKNIFKNVSHFLIQTSDFMMQGL